MAVTGDGDYLRREGGILLHPTSLPGGHGIGDLGAEARGFADFLAEAGQHLWQLLPLGPTGYGNSPYAARSAMGGNPLLISLDLLAGEGLLTRSDLRAAPVFPRDRVDHGTVAGFKLPLLRRAYRTFLRDATAAQRSELAAYRAANASWLEDLALFMALKETHSDGPWLSWEHPLALRQSGALERARSELAEAAGFHQFAQFLFSRQWQALKRHGEGRQVRIIGDIPIFVALDSADVWARPELFHLGETGHPTVVSGVPPDYFSKTGQRWGNPLYRWDVMAEQGYAWWVERFQATLAQVDLVRIDHFRGFQAHWEIPAGSKTAERGRWVAGPGRDLFEAVERALGRVPVIAEDLGIITPEVEALRDGLGYPGMKVLQFAFGGPADNPFLPHNYPRRCVVYTGTHDNDTAMGWLRSRPAKEREHALRYLGTEGREFNWDLIRLAFGSVADVAIVPLQDVLGLGSEARMNLPGQAQDNWEWRLAPGQLEKRHAERLREMAEVYGR